MSLSIKHSFFINETLRLAKSARKKGNHPFGAILVINDEVVMCAENKVVTSGDLTQHAELRLVSKASKELSKADLKSSILYTSTEPCVMCAGAIYWVGIRKVAYGCSAQALGEIATGSFVVPCTNVFRYGDEKTEVIGPINAVFSQRVHLGFSYEDQFHTI